MEREERKLICVGSLGGHLDHEQPHSRLLVASAIQRPSSTDFREFSTNSQCSGPESAHRQPHRSDWFITNISNSPSPFSRHRSADIQLLLLRSTPTYHLSPPEPISNSPAFSTRHIRPKQNKKHAFPPPPPPLALAAMAQSTCNTLTCDPKGCTCKYDPSTGGQYCANSGGTICR